MTSYLYRPERGILTVCNTNQIPLNINHFRTIVQLISNVSMQVLCLSKKIHSGCTFDFDKYSYDRYNKYYVICMYVFLCPYL